jgi:hypothetical protein
VKRVFNSIWKKQIVQNKSKVGFWKPKEDIRSVQRDNDKDCCEEARNRYKVWFMTTEVTHTTSIFATYRKFTDKEKIDTYNKDWSGIGHYDCEEFRKAMEERKPWSIAIEVLKFWDECEGE